MRIKNIVYFFGIFITFIAAPLLLPVLFFSRAKPLNRKGNWFHRLDDWFKARKDYLKGYTRLDFFDWANLSLYILGLILIVLVWWLNLQDINQGDLLQAIVLWVTAIAILQYTKETYWLKQAEQKNYFLARDVAYFEKAPFVIVNYQDPDCFYLKNVGRGVARNVRWEIIDSGINMDDKTVITAGETGVTKMCSTAFPGYKPSIGSKHEIKIEYEDIDGVPYITRLESGRTDDGYLVVKYGRNL